MPNWITTLIAIHGKSEDIYRFCEKHCGDYEFDFNTFVREPETESECPDGCNLNKNPEPGIGDDAKGREWFNWYDWRLGNWGCKWNAKRCEFENLPDFEMGIGQYHHTKCEIMFDTPWGPPVHIIDMILEDYKNLRIEIYTYSEETDTVSFYDDNANTDEFESDYSNYMDALFDKYDLIKQDDAVLLCDSGFDIDWSFKAVQKSKNDVAYMDYFEARNDDYYIDECDVLIIGQTPAERLRPYLDLVENNLKRHGNLLVVNPPERLAKVLEGEFGSVKTDENHLIGIDHYSLSDRFYGM